MKQKFQKGDLVRVAKDLGSTMQHFKSDCDAIVIGSYKDQYGGGEESPSYTIHIKGRGRVSWYYESQLTLIEKGRLDLIDQWKKEESELGELHGDLDWIFENGEAVLLCASGETVTELAKGLGVESLWGSRGEAFVYYANASYVLSLAEQFLENNDKEGWLKFSTEFKNDTRRAD